ncbi:Initiator Replication protein [Catalinimonas alkaloidigena]|uniref:Initiator Replication protein n=1 Tax=Catalinimonas alkaloidigena TaxID=1075417 RepID=A0A1G9UXA4_9BACT|nr:replication initiation protein [Catalinimonas alkaloidigena]SDM64572.1 Initiator Replication protein [Catalinimonas alkaloidigena]
MASSEKKKRDYVWQSNELVNARFTFQRLEQRIFLQTIASIRRDDNEFRDVDIDIRDMLGYELGGTAYQMIRDTCSSLLGKKIEMEDDVELRQSTRRRYRGYVLFTTVQYVEGTNTIKARLSPEIMPFLLQLKSKFTKAELDELMELDSHYSYRIYWLLKQFASFRATRDIQIDELKSMFRLEGKYDRYVDFRKNVIDQAQAELADTEMAFDYETITHKRRAVAIRFKLLKHKSDQLDLFAVQGPPPQLNHEKEVLWSPENPIWDPSYDSKFAPDERFVAIDLYRASRMLVTNGVDPQGCERWYQAMILHKLTPKYVISICKQAQEAVPQRSGKLTMATLRKRGGWIHKQFSDFLLLGDPK